MGFRARKAATIFLLSYSLCLTFPRFSVSFFFLVFFPSSRHEKENLVGNDFSRSEFFVVFDDDNA